MISIPGVSFQNYIYTVAMVSMSKSVTFLTIVGFTMKLY